MTSDVKISIDLLSPDPIPGKYVRRGNRHAVRFSSDDAIFRIETDGKSARIVKSAEVGYELILGTDARLTLKTTAGEFTEPNVATHSFELTETPGGFILAVEYSLPPHDERKSLRVKCEK